MPRPFNSFDAEMSPVGRANAVYAAYASHGRLRHAKKIFDHFPDLVLHRRILLRFCGSHPDAPMQFLLRNSKPLLQKGMPTVPLPSFSLMFLALFVDE
jgi:hypothetical protein